MTTNKTIIVKNIERMRLDVFLSEQLKISRSQAQKLIAQGQILINEAKPTKTGQRTKEGDKIVIARSLKTTKQSPIRPKKSIQNNKGIAASRSTSGRTSGLAMTPKIIAKTPDYLVVEKPCGMLTHPTQANEKNTLSTYLLKKYPEIKNVGDKNPQKNSSSHNSLPYKEKGRGWGLTPRPGIVHRLDKEASGLLVVARTQPMFEHLKQQFKNRVVQKEYIALAHGRIAKDWDEITFPIARGENSNRMAARPLRRDPSIFSVATEGKSHPPPPQWRGPGEDWLSTAVEGAGGGLANDGEKEAKTEFFVEKRFVNFTLLRVILHTGRMHQIRVHLLAYNHPLVGDPLYFHKKNKQKWDAKLGRLFLHSAKLGFTNLEGKKVEFESPMPKELEEFLKLLK